jgi:hypothetical protein
VTTGLRTELDRIHDRIHKINKKYPPTFRRKIVMTDYD